uniref:Retrovirus-related Pol polyprotein from transposon TNT 1-94 n=1 Tax=Tanacetum cinerariifolium TaxID=118510 RepID=A0A6L2NJW3_TANCI|nr:retrovirus-related Pol polyprotein from transposon TNT 1-94 [Tanacetum cinerariifolium]
MYENFNAPSTESFDSIFNRLQKVWNTHVVVLRNKANLDAISIDNLYNNFKFIEREVKRTVVSSSSSGSPNMDFLSSPGSTNEVDTAIIQVSVVSTLVSIVSSHDNTANLSDATVFDWSYMADDEVLTNMALMAFSDSKHLKFKGYGPKDSKSACIYTSNEIKKAPNAPIIKDWVSDSDENESKEMVLKSDNVQHKPEQANQPRKVSQNLRNNRTNWNEMSTQKLGAGFQFYKKAYFVYESFSHLIKDCDFHDKKMLDQMKEDAAKGDQAKKIDWNDPTVLRYHALQNRTFSKAEVRKNMIMYLKNQGGYKQSHFKGIKKLKETKVLSANKGNREEVKAQGDSDQDIEEMKLYMRIIPDEDIAIDSIPLATKPLVIVEYKIVNEGKISTYLIVRADGSTKRKSFGQVSLDMVFGLMRREVVPFEEQSDNLKKKLAINNKAKMVLYNALPKKEYEIIFMCKTAKDIWQSLLMTHQDNSQVKDNKIDLLVQQYEQFTIFEEESIDNGFARFNTIITSLKALHEGKKERVKSIALKAKKESSDDETSTSRSDDEEYTMAVRNFKKFFRRKGIFFRQPREEKKSFRQRDEKIGKSDRKCFRCSDPNHLIGDCLKPSRNKDQKAFIGEVYVSQPSGFIDFQKPNYVYKLKKALYGLKQAPKAWYDRLKAFLIKHKYSMRMVDNTLFTKKSKSHLIIVQIYVDDIIFGSTSQNLCNDFAKIMHDEFETIMMCEFNFFLGLQIKQMEDGIFFNQSKYVKEMLKKFRLEDFKPTKTPMSTEIKLTKDDEADSVDSSKYRGMIGSLLYLTASRPDIMFSVCLCAHFQETPKTAHLEAIKYIFRYIRGTSHLGLWYPKGTRIKTIVYADSDHAGNYVDRKSTSGVCTFMGCCLTSWFAKKQTALVISTTEAEYVSARKACQQALWMKQPLIDYGICLDDVPIMCKNKGAIDLSKNLMQHSRTKHIEIRHHFLRDNV